MGLDSPVALVHVRIRRMLAKNYRPRSHDEDGRRSRDFNQEGQTPVPHWSERYISKLLHAPAPTWSILSSGD